MPSSLVGVDSALPQVFSLLVPFSSPPASRDFLPTPGFELLRSSSGQHVRNRSLRSPALRSLNLKSGSSNMLVHLPTPWRLTPSRRWFVSSSDHFLLGLAARRFPFTEPLVFLSPPSLACDVLPAGHSSTMAPKSL